MSQASVAGPGGSASAPFTRANGLELYKMARDEELRRLESQRDEIDSMRQRAVQFLAFVGAATAFLAGTGLKAPTRDSAFYWIAGSSSAISCAAIFAAIAVLLSLNLPRPKAIKWAFMLKPGALLPRIESDVPRPDETDLVKHVTKLYAQMSAENAIHLKRMRRVYVWFLALGSVQVLGWVALVWARG